MPGPEKETVVEPTPLTDYEGSLLGLVLRNQPITAYQLLKFYEQSPVTRFNTSKGSVYPLIRRMKEAGLLEGQATSSRGRNPETLSCTQRGAEAVRAWVRGVNLNHVNLDDPLRTMVLSLEMLSRDEQLEWIADAKALVSEKMKAVVDYAQGVSVPFQAIVHKSTVESLRLKMEWLDDLLYAVVKGGGERRKPASDMPSPTSVS